MSAPGIASAIIAPSVAVGEAMQRKFERDVMAICEAAPQAPSEALHHVASLSSHVNALDEYDRAVRFAAIGWMLKNLSDWYGHEAHKPLEDLKVRSAGKGG